MQVKNQPLPPLRMQSPTIMLVTEILLPSYSVASSEQPVSWDTVFNIFWLTNHWNWSGYSQKPHCTAEIPVYRSSCYCHIWICLFAVERFTPSWGIKIEKKKKLWSHALDIHGTIHVGICKNLSCQKSHVGV
jgi:hypothetical protein